MFEKLLGFDWDGANEEHILKHGVFPEEIEEAVSGKHVLFTAKSVKREKRWKMLCRTETGRYLVVVFTVRHKLFRAITAYDMDSTERRTYASRIR